MRKGKWRDIADEFVCFFIGVGIGVIILIVVFFCISVLTGCASFKAKIPLPDGREGSVSSLEIFILSSTKSDTFVTYVFPDGSYLELGRGTSRKASETQDEIVRMAYDIGKATGGR